MPPFMQLKTNAGAVAQNVQQMAEHCRDMTPVLYELGERMKEYSIPQNFVAQGRPHKWTATLRGGAIGQDSGRLSRSTDWEINGATLKVGTNLIWAPQFHYGGTIKPKTAKTLAVPLGKTRSSPRRFPNLKWAPGVSKHPYARGVLGRYSGKGKRRKFTALFMLRSQVDQKPRPFLLFQEDDVQFARDTMVAWVRDGRIP